MNKRTTIKEMTREEYNRTLKEIEKLKGLYKKEFFDRDLKDKSNDFESESLLRDTVRITELIIKLQDSIKGVKIIESREVNPDVVNIGDIVNIEFIDDQMNEYFHIIASGTPNVDEFEIDEISEECKLGKAILGKEIDTVTNFLDNENNKVNIQIKGRYTVEEFRNLQAKGNQKVFK